MENLFILGIKHSGKTTFARLLAERLNLKSVDSDDLVKEEIKPLSIRDYYKKEGSAGFKRKEFEAVSLYLENTKGPVIMSLGGGASDNDELIDLLKKNGKLIYLKRKEEEMLPVILKHGIPAFLDEDDLPGSFHRVYKRRDEIYSRISDKTVDMGPYRDRIETLECLIQDLGDLVR